MDVFRFPFVLRLLVAGRMSDRDAAERLYVGRQVQIIVKLRIKVLVRIYACPYGSKSESLDCKEEVLCRSGAVLLPVWIIISSHPCRLSADNDRNRCLAEHLGIRKYFRNFIQLLSFRYDDKSPGLVVHCSRCCHGSLKDGMDVRFGNRFRSVLAYTLSAVDVFQDSIGIAA